jgi:hypothetical protein
MAKGGLILFNKPFKSEHLPASSGSRTVDLEQQRSFNRRPDRRVKKNGKYKDMNTFSMVIKT